MTFYASTTLQTMLILTSVKYVPDSCQRSWEMILSNKFGKCVNKGKNTRWCTLLFYLKTFPQSPALTVHENFQIIDDKMDLKQQQI